MSKGLCPYVKKKEEKTKRKEDCCDVLMLYLFQFPSTKYLCIIYNVTKKSNISMCTMLM